MRSRIRSFDLHQKFDPPEIKLYQAKIWPHVILWTVITRCRAETYKKPELSRQYSNLLEISVPNGIHQDETKRWFPRNSKPKWLNRSLVAATTGWMTLAGMSQ
jgi:hypothetical protein